MTPTARYEVSVYDLTDGPTCNGCWYVVAVVPAPCLAWLLAGLYGRSYDTVSIDVRDADTGDTLPEQDWPDVRCVP